MADRKIDLPDGSPLIYSQRLEHPIVLVIKEHRTLAKLLSYTLGSICSLLKLSMGTQRYTLHGSWLQTSTAIGRLSMEEPNLQIADFGHTNLAVVDIWLLGTLHLCGCFQSADEKQILIGQ